VTREREPRLDMQRSPTRCPYCHETCVASDPNVVCSQCLARHHTDCWDTHGACSNCSAPDRMERVEAPEAESTATLAPRNSGKTKAGSWIVFLVAVLVGYGTFAQPGLTFNGYLEAFGIYALCLPCLTFVSGWVSKSMSWALRTALASVLAGWLSSVFAGHLSSWAEKILFLLLALPLGTVPGLLAAWFRRPAANHQELPLAGSNQPAEGSLKGEPSSQEQGADE
jgi:hypothetical protein